jgi:sulfur carrier protein
MQLQLNGQPLVFKATPPLLSSLIESLGFTGKRIAVEHNGEIVPKSLYTKVQLQDQDCLEIIVAVGGG